MPFLGVGQGLRADARQLLGDAFRALARVREDQGLLVLFQGVLGQGVQGLVRGENGFDLFVGKSDALVEEHAFVELARAIVTFHEFRVEPLGKVFGVGNGRRQGEHLQVWVDLAELGDDHFQGRAAIGIEFVDFVDHEHAKRLQPGSVVANEAIQALIGRENQVIVG